ncbi:hypothetical protein [Halorussus salinisoli]|uniref:hypothetical protein n=1 Tax=Halorussus salinisoli TaxID=2558242 RepID=UPI002A90F0DA|nr:hypothetical protein [Halorussus salinisoli]
MSRDDETESFGSGESSDGGGSFGGSESSGGSSRLVEKKERLREWLLLDGNRLVVAGGVLVVVLAVLVAVERLGWVPMERTQPMYYVFSALISGNLTLITVVVSINQLLLGRAFHSPGELESEIRNVIEYRQEVEDHAGEVAPVKPQGFLELLFENTRKETERIDGMTFGAVGEETRSAVDDVVKSLTDHADRVVDLLDDSSAGTFDVLSVTLTTNYANEINRIRRIRWRHGDDLPESVMEALDDLIEHLQKVDVARQYFKSLYLQEELSALSRILLYAGLPAELISVVVLLGFTADQGSALTDSLPLLLPVTVTVAFLPLAILLSFIVRTATVTERTVATIPFTTPSQEQ